MPKPREKKDNHLLYADAVASRGKSGVWFGEREDFKTKQTSVMDAVKERVEWVPVENAVMAISLDPPGIVLMAPNPSLPGIIVLADGATSENTEHLKKHYTEIVQDVLKAADIAEEE
ncbi:hypothetical protein GCM10010260_12930 [Streptomyces filipinensis]|uniref:Uncharacterized protein n=1 Tax=Streptomyces filipinensis TaxID=66887 RepID=A0A918I7E1_9ACTN|nr:MULTISPECIES: hypothetical protein [Streptomyces]GGU81833.1 hypothetical protein GCM10010260_12930 [Streptomyces filipinensis]